MTTTRKLNDACMHAMEPYFIITILEFQLEESVAYQPYTALFIVKQKNFKFSHFSIAAFDDSYLNDN